MAWAKPEFHASDVNAAGRLLRQGLVIQQIEDIPRFLHAVDVANNWRAAHAFPLNTIQMNLRSTVKRIWMAEERSPHQEPVVAQRKKRLVSIERKLQLIPSMRLSQIQDIGGCRAILPNVKTVKEVAEFYLRKSRIEHQIIKVDDYVAKPKASGYRGIHLIFSYRSASSPQYNGLKIEMQLRSRYQHAWATAVETVGMFTGQALKSNLGSQEWIRFFALMSSFIAFRELRALVPDTPLDRSALKLELSDYAERLRVVERLTQIRRAMNLMQKSIGPSASSNHYYLLELDAEREQLDVTAFSRSEVGKADAKYAEAEKRVKDNPSLDAVLVSVDSFNTLSRAYPNYFADTRVFLGLLSQAVSGHSRSIPEPASLV